MFSWSRPPPPPGVAAAQKRAAYHTPAISRDAHLSSYLNHPVLKPSTRKVSVDDTIYDTVFQTTTGFALIVRVYMPTNPAPPSMTLHGVRASHEWLDIRMKVIGYAPISSDETWKSSNLKLGEAVYAVIHHLQLNPPSVLEITDANLRRLQESLSGTTRETTTNNQAPATSPATFQRQNNESSQMSCSEGNTRRILSSVDVAKQTTYEVADEEVDALIPPIPAFFPQIDAMTFSELKQLFDDESVFEGFVKQTSGVTTLKELKQSIETANVKASEGNKQHEEQVEGMCDELESLKQDLQTKIQRYKELDECRLAMTRPPDVQDAIRELNVAKNNAYHQSEEMAENWVEGGGSDINDFVKKFMETRMLYHARAAKVEKLGMSM
ncbi:hypothetical protein THAPSDRAFT_268881 [Thalassiosira pseudonana CCMP1335]|uniref:VPS37 C-terminal domain-containing protein n=1 Tax=Thalassiosira pseudonana TaxID=35128 RepID=B8C2M1_THAPS|nr:hypothetical protein THAPSDRAFT_268881 [Thalassiosira pseudonana CCMP1335]EED91971.1 hypothetical protein THAPSDRAFT_268881 [Thalassiosira pseudonana CCMP1335]|eukprot:g13972.t1 g13972   contig9:872822-874142(+)